MNGHPSQSYEYYVLKYTEDVSFQEKDIKNLLFSYELARFYIAMLTTYIVYTVMINKRECEKNTVCHKIMLEMICINSS